MSQGTNHFWVSFNTADEHWDHDAFVLVDNTAERPLTPAWCDECGDTIGRLSDDDSVYRCWCVACGSVAQCNFAKTERELFAAAGRFIFHPPRRLVASIGVDGSQWCNNAALTATGASHE